MYLTETETAQEVENQIRNAWDKKQVENIRVVPEVVFDRHRGSGGYGVLSEP